MTASVNHEELENSPALKPYYDNRKLFFRNVFWLLFGSMAGYFGLMTSMNLMPLHMEAQKMTAAQIGLAISIRCFLAAPMMLYFAYLSDHWHWRLGRRLSFVAISLPILVVTVIIFPYTTTVLTCTMIYVAFMAGCNILSDTFPLLMYDISKNKYWGRVSGFSWFFMFFAVWLGQVILMPMVDTHGEKIVYVICGSIMFIGIMTSIIFVKEPPIRGDKCPSLNPIPIIKSFVSLVASRQRIFLILAFVLVACMNIPINFTPLQAKVNIGLSIGDVGTKLMQYGTIITAIFTIFSGYAIDKIGAFRAIIIGFIFAVIAGVIGFKPDRTAEWLNHLFNLHLTATTALAIAYTCAMIGNIGMYMSALIFATSAVGREDTAKIYACNAAANNLFQSLMIYLSGWMITNIFREYYGYAYLIGIILCALGMPIFFFLDKHRTKIIVEAKKSEMENSKGGDVDMSN